MKYILSILSFVIVSQSLAQAISKDNSEAAKAHQKEYEKNIKLTKIADVYIPASIDEAHNRLKKLSPQSSLAKFSQAQEKEVCRKIHFGMGRWMIQNWSFYNGSRLSHLLKTKGVRHPDDMAQFLLRTFHRRLNNKPLEEESLINELAEARKIAGADSLGIPVNPNK